MSLGHLFKNEVCERTTIPEEGISCFSETNSAWSGPSYALLYVLNDPILSRLDTNGKSIAFNFIIECYHDRVARNLADFDTIEEAFSQRGVNIWSLRDKIGSKTHRDEFRQLIQRAEDSSTLLSDRMLN